MGIVTMNYAMAVDMAKTEQPVLRQDWYRVTLNWDFENKILYLDNDGERQEWVPSPDDRAAKDWIKAA